jgi:hypothetical protein
MSRTNLDDKISEAVAKIPAEEIETPAQRERRRAIELVAHRLRFITALDENEADFINLLTQFRSQVHHGMTTPELKRWLAQYREHYRKNTRDFVEANKI